MEPDLGKKKEWDEILNYMDNINLYAESSVLCFQDSKLYEKLLRFVTNDRTFQIHQCILTEDHDGMYFPTSSIMHRYKLYGIYESRPYEGEIIVKLQTHNTHGSNITMGLLQENEMIAYETIIPVLENFCDGHFPAPLVFYARSEVLVMEFLGNRHFLPIHKTVKGVRHEYVEPILKVNPKFCNFYILNFFEVFGEISRRFVWLQIQKFGEVSKHGRLTAKMSILPQTRPYC